jgi:hypothetical protein
MVSTQKQWFKGKSWSTGGDASVAIADLDPRRVRRAIVAGVAALATLILVTAALILWGPGSDDQLFPKIFLLGFGAVFAAIGAFSIFVIAPATTGKAQAMATTPTSNVATVLAGTATGTVELKGTADGDNGADPASLLTAPLSGTSCLYYGVGVVQVTEVRSRSSDNTWTTHQQRSLVAAEASDRPFWLTDSTGRIAVAPMGADVVGRVTAERQEEPRPGDRADDLLAGQFQVKGVTVSLPWRSDDGERVLGYEIIEQVIAPGDPLYVLGPTGTHDGTLVVVATRAGETFVIRVGTEEEAIADARSQERLIRLVGAAFGAIGVILLAVGLGLVIAL